MQETVTSPSERKSLFSSFLEVMETKERQAQAERQLQEEKYMRRTQRIYDFHDRQRREAAELRRCVEYVSSHALALESALRGGAAELPLGAALARQAAALQRCMAQCVANAAAIRARLAHAHQPQMDSVLAKMERELRAWTAFVQRAALATAHTEVVVDNLHNMIAEQRRCVREVSSSCVFAALCGGADAGAGADADAEAGAGAGAGAAADGDVTPRERRGSVACSTPIQRD